MTLWIDIAKVSILAEDGHYDLADDSDFLQEILDVIEKSLQPFRDRDGVRQIVITP